MNIPDWAITPGARKSRYGTPSDGIAWIRLNVSPKITSHRTGWTARVTSSVRSWRSFWSSTRQKVPTAMDSDERRERAIRRDGRCGECF